MTTKKVNDPLEAARWVEANIDVAELSGKLLERFGLAAAPGRILALTPFELIALFTRPRDDSGGDIDRLAELHRINHVVRAGKPPVVPTWLMEKVPRR